MKNTSNGNYYTGLAKEAGFGSALKTFGKRSASVAGKGLSALGNGAKNAYTASKPFAQKAAKTIYNGAKSGGLSAMKDGKKFVHDFKVGATRTKLFGSDANGFKRQTMGTKAGSLAYNGARHAKAMSQFVYNDAKNAVKKAGAGLQQAGKNFSQNYSSAVKPAMGGSSNMTLAGSAGTAMGNFRNATARRLNAVGTPSPRPTVKPEPTVAKPTPQSPELNRNPVDPSGTPTSNPGMLKSLSDKWQGLSTGKKIGAGVIGTGALAAPALLSGGNQQDQY